MRELFTLLQHCQIDYDCHQPINSPSLSFDAFCLHGEKVQKGSVFCVTKGNHRFIGQAIANSCNAILMEECYLKDISNTQTPIIIIKDLEARIPALLTHFYELNSFHPKLIGITGTNGKTSSTHFVAQLLNQKNYQVGLLGTLGNGIFKHDCSLLQASPLTTLDTISLYQQLADFNQQKVDFIVMEVSSHGIEQNRIMGLKFDVVCFTNLSPEHLDYHQDMEQYFACKSRLFQDYVKSDTHYVINHGDDYGKRLLNALKDTAHISHTQLISYQYLLSPTPLASDMHDITLTLSGNQPCMHASYQGSTYPITTAALSTEIEYKNMLCAFAILLALKQHMQDIVAYGQYLHSVAGRMQKVSTAEDDITVIIDYAHTEDALLHALNAMRVNLPSAGHLICVFGCGGNRDKSKREAMAQTASRLCDKVYITDDNPRNEVASDIRQQIIKGIDAQKISYTEIGNRATAIKRAVVDASPQDSILIAGKGHEKYQLIMGDTIPFDDVKESQKALYKRAHLQQGETCP